MNKPLSVCSNVTSYAPNVLGSRRGDEAGRLMLAGASTWGTQILHFFAHVPCRETSVYINNLKLKHFSIFQYITFICEREFYSSNHTVLHALTCVVGGTKTGVVVDSIDAGGSVLTFVVFTVISVNLASRALKAQWACTAVTTYMHTSSCQVLYEVKNI